MKKIFSNKIFQTSLAVAIVFLAGAVSVQAKNTNNTVNNNVRSSASSGSPRFEDEAGGNTGENITTGDASARTSVKTETNGTAGETSIKVDASAEANGKKVEVNAESSGGEDINIQKEITEEGASASVDVEIDQPEVEASRAGVFSKVTKAIGSLFDKLLSIFS